MPLSPGTRFGHYEIAALIGVGGMGEVYRAGDTNLKRDVAIKMLPHSLATDAVRLARLQREAEMLAALNHHNIAHVYGLERADAMTGLVMELVEGPTLAERITHGPLPLEEALSIARQIADGLEAAHQRAIVHRDLKPANIKLSADGTVKVLDFGIAKALQPPLVASGPEPIVENTPSLTQMGMILGTAAYMSPEQARGKTVDKRTDIWAFACVVYEMLTGQPAFAGEDATVTIGRVLEREVDMGALPKNVPTAVRQTLKACLQKDPKKRVRDIGDVKLALEGAFETRVERAPRRAAWRHRMSLAAAFVAGIVVLALAAWQIWPAPELRAVTRLSVPIDITERFVSISRDGSRIAYRAGADRSIYVRDLGEFDARRIPGTAGAAIDLPPCFSPDGAWIAFFAVGQQLKKVSLAGGAALVVAQAVRAANVCDWGEDGYLYFTTNSGVMRAPEAGGPAELVAAPNAERNEVSFQSPHLLPAGERLLYSVYGTEGTNTARIDVLDLRTHERKTVLAGVGVATYVPARSDARRGYLVYGSGGTLFAAPFDPVRLEAGAARPVASDVLGLGAFSSGVVSESGTLAYLSAASLDAVDAGATLIAVDRDGAERVVSAQSQLYGEVSISPDGTRAVLTVQDPQTSSVIDLWIYELDGDRMSRLTLDDANYSAIWTADNRRLVYMHTRTSFAGAPGIRELRSVPADDSVPPSTIEGSTDWMRGISLPTSLSPNGETLLVVNDDLAAPDILAFELDSGLDPKAIGAPRDFLVTSFRERGAVFSPDGSLVAYTSDQSGDDEVYVVPYPGPGGRLLVSRGGGTLPRWSSNGRELFYVSGGNLMSVGIETAPRLQASTPRVLFAIPPLASYGGLPYDVSPDGTRFLMLKAGTRSQQVELRVVVNWIDELERTGRAAQQ